MTDLSKVKCLVIDSGLFVPIGEKLAETYSHVYYAMGHRESFPTSHAYMVGQGLENVETVLHYEDYIDRVDLIVFPDVYFGSLQNYLRQHDYRVWGSGLAEGLELNRWGLKETLKSVGLPVGQAWEIEGIDALRDFLDEHEEVYVKMSFFRGDLETFRSRNGAIVKDKLDELELALGPFASEVRFVVEEGIDDAIEVGFDGFCIDGEFPETASFGFEVKDAGLVGKVVTASEMPRPLRIANEKLAPALVGCRGFYSNELRVTKDGTPYIIDMTMRAGSPPSESYIELFTNWAEVIYEGAGGNLVDLIPAAKYSAQIILRSEWATKHYLPVYYPPGLERWVKLHAKLISAEGQVYVSPVSGAPEIGAVVAIGDSLEDTVGEVIERVEQVEALELDYDKHAMQACLELIEKCGDYDVEWD